MASARVEGCGDPRTRLLRTGTNHHDHHGRFFILHASCADRRGRGRRLGRRRFGGFGPAIGAALIVAGLGAWTQHAPTAVEPAAHAASHRAGHRAGDAGGPRPTPMPISWRASRPPSSPSGRSAWFSRPACRRRTMTVSAGSSARRATAGRRACGPRRAVRAVSARAWSSPLTATSSPTTTSSTVREKVRVEFTDGRTFEAQGRRHRSAERPRGAEDCRHRPHDRAGG